MKPVEFENGTVEIDASVIAEGLGIALPLLWKRATRWSSAFATTAAIVC